MSDTGRGMPRKDLDALNALREESLLQPGRLFQPITRDQFNQLCGILGTYATMIQRIAPGDAKDVLQRMDNMREANDERAQRATFVLDDFDRQMVRSISENMAQIAFRMSDLLGGQAKAAKKYPPAKSLDELKFDEPLPAQEE